MALFIGVREPSTEPGIDAVVRYGVPHQDVGQYLLRQVGMQPDDVERASGDVLITLDVSRFPEGLARG